jgi:hypothetical protein
MSLQQKIDQFYGKKFRYDNKEYAVVDVMIRETKAVIRTDKRTFVFFESELVLFMNCVEFIVNANQVEPSSKSHNAEVIVSSPPAVKNVVKVNNKLMEMFDLISVDSNKENIAKAETMVKLSDAMVKNELIRLKLLQIK